MGKGVQDVLEADLHSEVERIKKYLMHDRRIFLPEFKEEDQENDTVEQLYERYLRGQATKHGVTSGELGVIKKSSPAWYGAWEQFPKPAVYTV